MIDLYNFRVRLIKKVQDDQFFNPDSYSTEYVDGVNMVLDAVADITGLKFPHMKQNWDIM